MMVMWSRRSNPSFRLKEMRLVSFFLFCFSLYILSFQQTLFVSAADLLEDESIENVEDRIQLLEHYASLMATDPSSVPFGVGRYDIDQKILLGVMLMNSGLLQESIEHCEAALEEHPDVVAMYIILGTVYSFASDYDSAIEVLSSGIELDPEVSALYERRSQAYSLKHMYNEALEDLNKAIELNPTSKNYLDRGSIYMKMLDKRAALEDGKKALQLNPGEKQAKLMLGMALYDTGRCWEAIDTLKEVYDEDPLLNALRIAMAYKELGVFKEADHWFTKTIEQDEKFAIAHQYRANLRYLSGRINKAKDDLVKCIRLENLNLNCRHLLAILHHGKGNFSEAIRQYDQILEIDPGHVSHYQKDIAFYQSGHLDVPIKEFNMDKDIDGAFKKGYFALDESGQRKHIVGGTTKIQDVVVDKFHFGNSEDQTMINTLLNMAMYMGRKIGLNADGFLQNPKQYRAMGFGIIEAAQELKKFWESKGTLKVSGAGSSYSAAEHVFGYRDFFDIFVKWRQYSEPNDNVFWNDRIDTKGKDGIPIGSQTIIVNGQVQIVRYYQYFDKVFRVMKHLIYENYNGTDYRSTVFRTLVEDTRNLYELHNLIQQEFWVATKVQSYQTPSVTYEGTRISLKKQPPNGFVYAIETVLTAERWEQYDRELRFIWDKLTQEALKPNPSPQKIQELGLLVAYFWYTSMPLSRGSAVVGHAAMYTILLALGLEGGDIPRGIQPDWEAFIAEDSEEFVRFVKGWLTENAQPCLDEIHSLPSIAATFPTLRAILQILNVPLPKSASAYYSKNNIYNRL